MIEQDKTLSLGRYIIKCVYNSQPQKLEYSLNIFRISAEKTLLLKL